MPNWESETRNYVNQQQQQLKQQQYLEESIKKSEVEKKLSEEKRTAIDKITTNHELITNPGFQILDKFKVKDNLEEIKDQVWKIGEIVKIPNIHYDLSEIGIKPKDQFEQNTVDNIKSFFKKNDLHKIKIFNEELGFYSAKYILHTKTVEYVPLYTYSDKYDSGIGGDFVTNNDNFLIIGTDCKNIYISGIKNTKISLDKSEEEIKNNLHQTLLEDCSKRHDFSQINPKVFSYGLFSYLRDGLEKNLPEELQQLLLPYKQTKPNYDRFDKQLKKLNIKNGIETY